MKAIMNGAIKLAELHPSIGPWVRLRMKQTSAPVMSRTPTTSMRFQRGTGWISEE